MGLGLGWMEGGEGGRISQLNFSGAISLSVYAELRRTLCGVTGRGWQTFLLFFFCWAIYRHVKIYHDRNRSGSSR